MGAGGRRNCRSRGQPLPEATGSAPAVGVEWRAGPVAGALDGCGPRASTRSSSSAGRSRRSTVPPRASAAVRRSTKARAWSTAGPPKTAVCRPSAACDVNDTGTPAASPARTRARVTVGGRLGQRARERDAVARLGPPGQVPPCGRLCRTGQRARHRTRPAQLSCPRRGTARCRACPQECRRLVHGGGTLRTVR